jgi:hypothetical protein
LCSGVPVLVFEASSMLFYENRPLASLIIVYDQQTPESDELKIVKNIPIK